MNLTIDLSKHFQFDPNDLNGTLGITVNELIATDIIKESDVIHQWESPDSQDESYTRVLVIQYPESDPNGIQFQNDFLDILFHNHKDNKPNIPEEETCHLHIQNNTEYADLHFNDNTLHIIYHYTGQW